MAPQAASSWTALALALSLALPACKYAKDTIPEARSVSATRVPAQQRIVALAIEEAVESLDFKAIAGKTVSIELTGIFPHSRPEALDYLTQQVESKLARSGVRVVAAPPREAGATGTVQPSQKTAGISETGPAAPPPPLKPVPTVPSWARPSLAKAKAAEMPAPAPVKPPPPQAPPAAGGPEPDYRLLVGVSWGGIDTRDKVRTDEPLLFGQLSLAGGGLLGGAALITASDSSFRKGFSATLMVGALAGAVTWYLVQTPFPHMYTLIGRVRVLVRGVPTKEGTAFTTEGNGSSKVIVDQRNPEGYRFDGDRVRVVEGEERVRLIHGEQP